MKTAKLPRITEKQFMAQVKRFAELHGWTVYHTFDSRRSGPGFPDLVFGRGPGNWPRLVAAELKVGKNKVTVFQLAWLGHFEGQGVPTYLWTPDDWELIERILGA